MHAGKPSGGRRGIGCGFGRCECRQVGTMATFAAVARRGCWHVAKGRLGAGVPDICAAASAVTRHTAREQDSMCRTSILGTNQSGVPLYAMYDTRIQYTLYLLFIS